MELTFLVFIFLIFMFTTTDMYARFRMREFCRKNYDKYGGHLSFKDLESVSRFKEQNFYKNYSDISLWGSLKHSGFFAWGSHVFNHIEILREIFLRCGYDEELTHKVYCEIQRVRMGHVYPDERLNDK